MTAPSTTPAPTARMTSMTPMRTVRLVAVREMRERVSSRSFQVSTALTVLLVAAALFLPALFGAGDPPSYTVGATGDIPSDLAESVAGAATDPETEVTTTDFPDRSALETAVTEGDVDLGVIGATTVLVGPDSDTELVTLVTATLQAAGVEAQADALGLAPEEVAELFAGGVTVEELETQDDQEERSGIAFIGTFLLFVSIVTYGQWILIGVVEEKTSRVVEVILGAVQPRHLLAGKVIGIGVLGLAQLVLITAIGLIAMRTNEQFDVPSIGVGFAVTLIGWFLLGFTFYAAGYAVAGSLVSRQEDAQNASFPLTLVMLVAYFVAISAIGGEDNPVLRVLSIIPPFSAITMPVRQATGNATALEVLVSIVLMLAAIVLMLRVGGRIYAGGLLRAGGRVKVREAFRSADG